MSGRTREDVLRDLVRRYQEELARAWVDEMTLRRVALLRDSLDSAHAELCELLRAKAVPS